jgi:hypothetical protein
MCQAAAVASDVANAHRPFDEVRGTALTPTQNAALFAFGMTPDRTPVGGDSLMTPGRVSR